jgi:hypothetical protein
MNRLAALAVLFGAMNPSGGEASRDAFVENANLFSTFDPDAFIAEIPCDYDALDNTVAGFIEIQTKAVPMMRHPALGSMAEEIVHTSEFALMMEMVKTPGLAAHVFAAMIRDLSENISGPGISYLSEIGGCPNGNEECPIAEFANALYWFAKEDADRAGVSFPEVRLINPRFSSAEDARAFVNKAIVQAEAIIEGLGGEDAARSALGLSPTGFPLMGRQESPHINADDDTAGLPIFSSFGNDLK